MLHQRGLRVQAETRVSKDPAPESSCLPHGSPMRYANLSLPVTDVEGGDSEGPAPSLLTGAR